MRTEHSVGRLRGRVLTLTFQPARADKKGMASPGARLGDRVNAGRSSESGQAMVEFALILTPLLILVSGIIYFGIGLNYWLDMQRIANQGGRWAAVNNWPPECPRGATSCTTTPACDDPIRTNVKLQNSLKCMAIAGGLQGSVTPTVCFPSGSTLIGDPVRVRLEAPFNFFWVTDVFSITLRADATMRLEQSQDPAKGGLITGDPC